MVSNEERNFGHGKNNRKRTKKKNLIKELIIVLGIGNGHILIEVLGPNELHHLMLSLHHCQLDFGSSPLLWWCGLLVQSNSDICCNSNLLLWKKEEP